MNKKAKFLFPMMIFLLLVSIPLSIYAANESPVSLEKRDAIHKDDREWLTIKQSDAGLRIVTSDGKKEIAVIDNFGGIYLNGDVFLNNKNLNESIGGVVSKSYIDTLIIIILVMFVILSMVLIFLVMKMKSNINKLKTKIIAENIKGDK